MAILIIMSVTALVSPAGELTAATGPYLSGAFAEGLTQGYMTMDALGSIGFGWIIFRAIRSMGVDCPKATAKYTLIAALMYAVAWRLFTSHWLTLARQAHTWVLSSAMVATF